MILTDEQFAARLRSRAAVAAPPMTLDDHDTMRLGTRRRRARRWGTGAGITAGVAAATALVVGGMTVFGGPGVWRQPVAQSPYPIGTEQVADLAPGITATNRLIETTLSGGGQWWDTGLRIDSSDASGPLSVGFAPLADAHEKGNGLAQGVEDPTSRVPQAGGLVPLNRSRGGNVGGSVIAYTASSGAAAHVLSGFVPAWVHSPHVLLYLPGPTASWLQLPTVADPQGTGRLLFAAVIGPDVAWTDDARTQPRVLVVAGDGSSSDVSQVCGSGLTTACLAAQPDGGTALAQGVTALGGQSPQPVNPPVVTVARGVEAAAGPVVIDGYQAVVGTLSGTRVVVDRLADTDPDVMQLAAFDSSSYVTGDPQDLPLGPDGATQSATLADGRVVELLVAPSGMPGARAFVWSTAGWTRSDGATAHAVEVPTFTLPVRGAEETDRRFAAVGLAAPSSGADDRGVAFAGPDGTIVVPGCAGQCAGVPYDELGALVAG